MHSQGSASELRPGEDWVDVSRDSATGIETIRAHFTGHAYDPHFHDASLVGVTEQGLQEFSCRRALHRSTPGRVILIEPGETHDGNAPDEAGFTYLMLYLDASWLAKACTRAADGAFPHHQAGFRATLNDEPRLAAVIRRAFSRLHAPESRLARDEALDSLAAALNPHLGASVVARVGALWRRPGEPGEPGNTSSQSRNKRVTTPRQGVPSQHQRRQGADRVRGPHCPSGRVVCTEFRD
ncbi:AraC family ligand binding domain-containing protein [Hyalangium gracile]|uniref:AraC family ligand binding domain-containing protein n=1 Tax=Hyalangium gracile TaxID=394092 RepID=UPI001CC9A442|nr:AraC family ligand binding domain-containing protein [Hyalangium gracile]